MPRHAIWMAEGAESCVAFGNLHRGEALDADGPGDAHAIGLFPVVGKLMEEVGQSFRVHQAMFDGYVD